ncbi:MAG: Pr6Pr family membrane protein [Eubacterium sp.]|nr:Pr6Pr family membrane protein [Eubacterium sp.]
MKQRFELIYRITFIIICATGIFIHLDLNDRNINAHELSFFTLWSNIFCLVFMIILLIKHFLGKDTRSRLLTYFKGMALSSIICTFLVYHFSENKIILSYDTITSLGLPLESILAHYVVPFMFILDWIIFQPKGLFEWKQIITWLAFPLVYIICFFTRCHCNRPEEFIDVPKYPYFFLDYDCIGIGKCCLYIVFLMIVFLIVNLVIILMDKSLYDKQRAKKQNKKQ